MARKKIDTQPQRSSFLRSGRSRTVANGLPTRRQLRYRETRRRNQLARSTHPPQPAFSIPQHQQLAVGRFQPRQDARSDEHADSASTIDSNLNSSTPQPPPPPPTPPPPQTTTKKTIPSIQTLSFDSVPPVNGSYDDKLRLLYNDLKSPSAFSAKLEDFLRQHEPHSLNRRVVKRTFPRRRIRARFPFDFWMADTINYLMMKGSNDGFAYILVIVDCFTRRIWAVPMKKITGDAARTAFESVFEDIQAEANYPRHLVTDGGTEFFNSKMSQFYKSYDINHFKTPTQSPSKASMAERAIRTLKTRLSRYMQFTGKKRWIDVLSQLVRNYNATPHSSLPGRLTPNTASISMVKRKQKSRLLRRPRLHIGDRVRILLRKRIFDKGYARSWSHQIYTVERVYVTSEVVYYRVGARGDSVGDGEKMQTKKLMPGIYYYYQLNLVSR